MGEWIFHESLNNMYKSTSIRVKREKEKNEPSLLYLIDENSSLPNTRAREKLGKNPSIHQLYRLAPRASSRFKFLFFFFFFSPCSTFLDNLHTGSVEVSRRYGG